MKYLIALAWLGSFMAMKWFLYVPQRIPLIEWIAALAFYGASVYCILLFIRRIKNV